ncbi:MAG: hypothetical protein J0H68_05940 [Sphingobacteriia bacterium]|nr:hypothetical protein [Sphingobacteriia bacterium]
MNSKLKPILQNIILATASTLFFIFLIEFTFGFLYQKNFFELTELDKTIFNNRYFTFLRLSKDNINDLMYPENKKAFSKMSNETDKVFLEMMCYEFYDQGTIWAFETDIAKNAHWYKDNLKEKNISYKTVDSRDEFFKLLAEKSKNKKLITSFGGSTTVLSINWPYHFLKNVDADYKNYILLNLGQPGYNNESYLLLIKALSSYFTKYSITPSIIISLDGVNEYLIYLFKYLNDNKNMQAGASKPAEYKSSIMQNLAFYSFKIMPYTSTYFWRMNTFKNNKKNQYNLSIDENNTVKFEQNFTEGLLNNFRKHHNDFIETLNNKFKAPHFHFLQPILTEKYYPLAAERHKFYIRNIKTPIAKEYRPTLDYTLAIYGLLGINIDVYLNVNPIYKQFEDYYTTFSIPSTHFSLSHVFNHLEGFKNDVYSGDAVHYSIQGSEIIAKEMYKILKPIYFDKESSLIK